jgi:BMFP domain-containing protein YqiC
MSSFFGENEVQEMGWGGLGLSDENDPSTPLLGWDEHVVSDFGAYIGLGYVCDNNMPPVEVTDEDIQTSGFGGGFRTPVLELDPDDLQQYQNTGELPDGSLALGDDGTIYQYDGMDGFFKKLFRRIRKGIKKVRSKIRKGIRKLLKRTKFGRLILKVRDKIVHVMMKIVRPLMKFVGKWAGKLAPIAAMIPGYGPAIAGALKITGTIAKIAAKTGAVMKNVMGPPIKKGGKPVKYKKYFFKTPAHEEAFKKHLKHAAKKMSKRPKTELEEMNAKLRALDPKKHSKSDVVTDEQADHNAQVMSRARRGHLMPGMRNLKRRAA